MWRSYVSYQNEQGERLRALRERPGDTMQDHCVVFCHGRSVDKDELGAFVVLSDALIAAGYDVFRFDFRGHGQSDGNDFSIITEQEDIRMTTSYLSSLGYTSYSFVVASFAGTAILPFLAETDEEIHGLVLWNAVVDLDYVKYPQTDEAKNKYSRRKELVREQGYVDVGRRVRISAVSYEAMLEAEPWKAFAHIPCPIVMIHGTDDEFVPFSFSQKYANMYEHVTMLAIDGGIHGFHGGKIHEAVAACVEAIDSF